MILKDEISRILTEIFNLSLTSGKFIDKLKMTRVIPLYKNKGSEQEMQIKFTSYFLVDPTSFIFQLVVLKKKTDLQTVYNKLWLREILKMFPPWFRVYHKSIFYLVLTLMVIGIIGNIIIITYFIDKVYKFQIKLVSSYHFITIQLAVVDL